MPVAAATFVVALIIVLGAYWLFVMLPEARAGRRLRKRLQSDRPETAVRRELMVTRRKTTALKGLDRFLSRSGRLADPLRRTVEQSGLSITIGLVVLSSIFAALAAFGAVLAISSLVWLATIAAAAIGAVPFCVVRYAATRRIGQFEDQFPQAMDLIAGALRAGHAFSTAVSMVADDLQDPTGAEFRLLYDRQNYGMPFPDALRAFAARVPLLDAKFFATAVLTQREAGGNLAEVLDNLAILIRERSRVRRQVRIASAHGRITGWVLSLMPPALAAVMFFIAPDHMKTFVEDPLGVRMIIAALFLQVVGTLAVRRIVAVEF
jgi:tight adherence protein B